MEKIIKIKDFSKYYGAFLGVSKVNLEVNEGDFFGFIGPNGAGKSTVIRTMLGLLSKTSGDISLFGKAVTQHNINDILSDIGYMPSEALFYNNLKVKEVIALSAQLHNKDCTAFKDELVSLFNLDINKKIGQLSLGNRKKVSIVCALQHKPKLLVLDEPTSGLDPLMQVEFFKVLQRLNKENGTTIFLSSHNLKEIEHYCTSFAFIKDGRIVDLHKIKQLNLNNHVNVKITGVKTMPEIKHAKLKSKSGNYIEFMYNGDTKDLLVALSKLKLESVEIVKPELEEMFLNLYDNKEGK